MSILKTIRGHEDLLNLSDAQRKQLCDEIREFLVSNVSQTGGHLASNLGVVELAVAIETVFNTMVDRLVFDVGHQSYVHKLLTGRQADFSRLRQFGGISGFPKPRESGADAFVAGHASSSISIALGMARARTLLDQDYQVVALMGDGAATGGMIYEGLNDAAVSREPMVIILNDNEMSIDKNVGGMSRHLSLLRTKEQYLGAKRRYRIAMNHIPGGKTIFDLTKRAKDRLKRLVLPSTIFENMGLQYLGPVDGHDVEGLIQVLRSARDLKSPVVVHVITKKGTGFLPAEQDPARFHGIGKFDPSTGESQHKTGESFSDAFGRTMCDLAREDKRVCAITAAMPAGTGLVDFMKEFPKRAFDVGIAEEHAVSMAGGLAKQGMVPIVALYSTFLQRSYDQILQDICLLNLHVVLAVDRAGLVGEDGETHHGVFDVGFLRHAPGMTVLCPANCQELSEMLRWAVLDHNGPVAIRYPRGGNGELQHCAWSNDHSIVAHRNGKDCAIVTYGTSVNNALAAADRLQREGIEASVVRLTKINPLPVDALREVLEGYQNILVLEETASAAGIHQELAWNLPGHRYFSIDLGNDFVTHGAVSALYQHCGMDPDSIAAKVKEVLSQ